MRWIVDAMNVIGARPDGWWRDRHGAMVRLVDRLEAWARTEQVDVTVVFEQPPSPPIVSEVVTIAYAPTAAPNSADGEILRLVRADARPGDILVVTSDRALASDVVAAGAEVSPVARLRPVLDPRAGRSVTGGDHP